MILYQKGKGFQALSAVNMKILSECEGFHTTEGILPSLPLAYLTCSSLRQKRPDEMLVHFSPGVWGFDIFQVRHYPQVCRWDVT